jgi:hypothetical protein
MVGTAILRVEHQVIQKEAPHLIHVLHALILRLHIGLEQLLQHEKEVREAHTAVAAVHLHHALQAHVQEAAHTLRDQGDHEAVDILAEGQHLLIDRIAVDILAEGHLLEVHDEADARCRHLIRHNSSIRILSKLLRRYT